VSVNADQIALWNGVAGDRRADHPRRSDRQMRLLSERLRAVAAIGPDEHVLDVGCGTGGSTRDAARAAVQGSALGVDLSRRMLAEARRLSAEEGLGNATFELADAQVHPFGPERFDVAISRFGVMFFGDPVAAFANIGRALRPGGRLALMVWQAQDLNEWTLTFHRALSGSDELPALPATGNPYSLADPERARGILEAAGFTDAGFTDVAEPVWYGDTVDEATETVCSLPSMMALIEPFDEAGRARAVDRLRAALAIHDTGRGIWFGSRTWIITGRRGS
jgi:ubiquinone/menaquinone biosynthesis C-methylase UbiE